MKAGIAKFNASPFAGLNLLFDAGVLKRDARSVAHFLKSQQYVPASGVPVFAVASPMWGVCGCSLSALTWLLLLWVRVPSVPGVSLASGRVDLSKKSIGELLGYGGHGPEDAKRLFAAVSARRAGGSSGSKCWGNASRRSVVALVSRRDRCHCAGWHRKSSLSI